MYIDRVTTSRGIQSNDTIGVEEDNFYFYILSTSGLDVVKKQGLTRIAYITSSDFTCLKLSSDYLYIGTTSGLYRISKLLLSGNSAGSLSLVLSTPTITSDTITSLDVYNDTNILIGTDNGINFYNGVDCYTKSVSNGVSSCVLLTAKLYYSSYGDGIYYNNTYPTEDNWTNTGNYSSSSWSMSDNVHCLAIGVGTSTYDGLSNKICFGTTNGIYIIDSDEGTALSNGIISHISYVDLAAGYANISNLKINGNYLYAMGEGPDPYTVAYGYSCIDLLSYFVIDTYDE